MLFHVRRWSARIFIVAFVIAIGAMRAAIGNDMVETILGGHRVEGVTIRGVAHDLHLLGRDGKLWDLDAGLSRNLRSVGSQFQPYPPSEFRAALLRELGGDYEVSGTGHYFIAHPRGQRGRWVERFEDLYRSFVHYFSVRGIQPATPMFPLVGVVCKNREEFTRHSTMQGGVPNGVVGYYDINSNRLNFYDMGGGHRAAWQENAAVLIHEATHQMAFNTGIHSRYSHPPKWVAEGLAMLFEAPGVCDSRHHSQQADRVNRDRLRSFRERVLPHHKPATLADIVKSDDWFQNDPLAAYAEAWAFTFFIVETQPRQYIQFLRKTASRGAYQAYPPAQRIADFQTLFGSDWRMLEARFLRFMATL